MNLVYKGAHSALRLEVNGASIRLIPFESVSVTEAQLKTLKGRKHFNSLVNHGLITVIGDHKEPEDEVNNDGTADNGDISDSGDEIEVIDPDKYSRSQLVELANSAGIDVGSRDSKAKIAELLNEKNKANK